MRVGKLKCPVPPVPDVRKARLVQKPSKRRGYLQVQERPSDWCTA